MKRSSIIAWVIVGLLILGIIIWAVTQSSDESSSKSSSQEEIRPNLFDKLSRRIQQIRTEIAAQIDELKLTVEMQQYLDLKLNRILMTIKLILGALVASAIAILMLNGLEFWTSIISVSSLVCVGVPVLTFFFFKKIMDVRELMNWFFKKVKNLVHRKFGCDSATIYVMQSNIAAKQIAVEVLESEIVNR